MERPRLLTVVVPVYNELRTLRASIEGLLKISLQLPMEILVIDDGSTDGSADSIGDLLGSTSVRLIRHERNRGKGAAVRTGIERAAGDVLTIFDADLEYSPEDLSSLLEPVLGGDARVVYGTRSYSSHTAYSFWYVVGNRLVSLWASLLFNSWITDLETCLKLAYTSIWRAANIRSRGFGVEPEVTARFLRAGERIYEVPIDYRARHRDQGKKLTWVDGVSAVLILLRVRVLGR